MTDAWGWVWNAINSAGVTVALVYTGWVWYMARRAEDLIVDIRPGDSEPRTGNIGVKIVARNPGRHSIHLHRIDPETPSELYSLYMEGEQLRNVIERVAEDTLAGQPVNRELNASLPPGTELPIEIEFRVGTGLVCQLFWSRQAATSRRPRVVTIKRTAAEIEKLQRAFVRRD